MSTERLAGGQRGVSLLELLVFIVIVGLGVAGILAVLNVATGRSADPFPQRQALAIAEALLEEAQLAAFTWCDTDDADALTATSGIVGAGGCASTPEALGPEPGDARPFDNVNDYHGFAMAGITDLTGAAIAGLGDYSATVTVAPAGLGGIPADAALLVTVSVTGPHGARATLSGYRTRYAPNALP